MAVYMFDTDISSYIVKRSHDNALRRLQKVPVGDVCISGITKWELMFGVQVSPRQQPGPSCARCVPAACPGLDYPEEAAFHYAQIRTDLKLRRSMIAANNLLIAAHARCLGLTLVTNNTREFGRVQSLNIENWTKPTR
jgi:tRNA(fMet)-specific endonuclease VapC